MSRSSQAPAPPKGSAPLFAALGDETRLRIVSRLSDDGPMSITRLTARFHVTRQAITKHRRYLALISKQWDNALHRLRKFVED